MVNQKLDFIERVAWTAIQAFFGILIYELIKNGTDVNWAPTLYGAGIAALIAAGKVIVGQNTGKDNTGAVLPGQAVVK